MSCTRTKRQVRNADFEASSYDEPVVWEEVDDVLLELLLDVAESDLLEASHHPDLR